MVSKIRQKHLECYPKEKQKYVQNRFQSSFRIDFCYQLAKFEIKTNFLLWLTSAHGGCYLGLLFPKLPFAYSMFFSVIFPVVFSDIL